MTTSAKLETPAEIRHRWTYLRDLLIEQLERFESGALKLRGGEGDVSAEAVSLLKRHIEDFDQLIATSLANDV